MKAMPRTRVSLNSKAHQLGWLKTQKKFKNILVFKITIDKFLNINKVMFMFKNLSIVILKTKILCIFIQFSNTNFTHQKLADLW